MGLIESSDSNQLLAALMAISGLITVGILWTVRGWAVYLYSLGMVLSGLYLLAFSGIITDDPYRTLGGRCLIAFSAIGGAFLKNMALGLLAEPAVPVSSYRKSAVLIALGVLVIPALLADKLAFAALLNTGVVLILGRACQLAYRVGVEVNSAAGKFFTFLVGTQLILIAVLVLFSLFSGTVAVYEPQAVSVGTLAVTMGLVIINTALFIALVFDINFRDQRVTQKALLSLELARSRSQERETLLADMHDGLGSQIATARMRVERGQMTQDDVADLLRECMADIHLMVDTLRDQNDDLQSALVDYRTRIERRITELGIRLSWDVELDGAPPMAARRMLQVLRVIQESITNAIRHAKAKSIAVTVRHAGGAGYLIRVEDDGIGIADDAAPGRGLANMRRRARELGGTLDVRRGARAEGTAVTLSFIDRAVPA
ncbi:MAG: sensor histidine kinase [Gammaproteobacteria bacterium]